MIWSVANWPPWAPSVFWGSLSSCICLQPPHFMIPNSALSLLRSHDNFPPLLSRTPPLVRGIDFISRITSLLLFYPFPAFVPNMSVYLYGTGYISISQLLLMYMDLNGNRRYSLTVPAAGLSSDIVFLGILYFCICIPYRLLFIGRAVGRLREQR